MNQLTENELFVKYAKELKLPTFRENLEDKIAEATAGQWGYRRFLCELMKMEVYQRQDHRTHQRIKKGNFPQMKYLSELVREDLPADCRRLSTSSGKGVTW